MFSFSHPIEEIRVKLLEDHYVTGKWPDIIVTAIENSV